MGSGFGTTDKFNSGELASLLRATLESTADGILVVDREGAIAAYNQKFVEMWRIPEHILASGDDQRALSFVLDQLTAPAAFLAKVAELYNAPYAVSFDTLEFKDGRIFERYSRPHRSNDDGIGRVWSFRDVTERSKAELARTHLAAIVENSFDAVISRSLDGKILTWNASAERMFGYSLAEAQSQDMWKLIIPPECHEEVRSVRAMIERGVPTPPYESVRLTKDGRRLAVSIRASPICDGDGKLTGISILFRDIGERKQAEQERALLAAIVENASDAIFSRAPNGSILSWNAAAERIFGFTAAEVHGKDIRQLLVPPDLTNEAEENRRQLAQGAAVRNLETSRLTKGGGRISLSQSIFPVKDGQGEVVRIATIARDISERRRSEEVRARLASIVENANDAIISRALDGTILSWNSAAERMFGYTAAEAIGQPISMLYTQSHDGTFAHNNEKMLRGEAIGPVQSRRMARDGTIVDVTLNVSPIRSNGGDVVGASVILRDISPLKRAAETIRESEERFRAAFEQAEIGMGLRSIDPKNPRWLRVNQKLCEIFGYSAEELLQITTLDLTPPEERTESMRFSERLMRGEITSYSREKRYVRKDGRIIWVHMTLSAISGGDGRPTHAISVIQDISERKAADLKMHEYTQRLRMLSRRLFEVEEIARRGLARELHDRLGQNVTALALNLNMIRGDLPADCLEKVAARIDDCEALLSASGQIIRDVMADLRPPGLDELGLIAALNHYARQIGGRAGLSIVVRDKSRMLRLHPDTETTLFRIAQEALTNVAKHARATEVVISLDSSPTRVVLTVADNGCGSAMTAQDGDSVHLGMVNMRERAEAIGATLRVESAPDQGTHIVVDAPRADQAALRQRHLPGIAPS
jgi:PAS domain S-box-containing protein